MKQGIILVLIAILLSACVRTESMALYGEIMALDKYQELFGNATEIRASYAYINDDNIPELLIADGDYEAARVSIFSINNNSIKYIGTFGSSCGQLDYIEKSSYVKSSYGNHGSFYQVYSVLEEDVTIFGDLFILQRANEQPKYYADFYPEGIGEDNFDYLSYVVSEEAEISEHEYNKKREKLESAKNGGWKSITYGEMTDINSLIGELR